MPTKIFKVQTRINSELYKALSAEAKRQDISLSEVIRTKLRHGCAEIGTKKNDPNGSLTAE
jgi:predicted HicB family RNase H-like nuclease